MWKRLPVLLKLALAWLPFLVVWCLFVLTYGETATLSSALVSGIYTIGGAAVLSLPVWWLTGRVAWPERVHVPFYFFHLMTGSLYAFTWLSIGYVNEAIRFEASYIELLLESDVVGWQFLTGFWLYGLVAGTSYAVRTRERLRDQERVAAIAEGVAARAQLHALRSQLNPHFLFNALHSLSVLIRESPDAAAKAVDELGTLLRYALDESGGDFVLLSEEWRFTRTYLDLERIRFGDRLQIAADLDPEALACSVPPFCLQPLVENAVRHGIGPIPDGGTITVTARISDGSLLLVVHDNGVGASDNGRAGGRGLESLERRLRSMYRDDAHLSVTCPDGGFEVKVVLPARQEEDGTVTPHRVSESDPQ